MKNNIFNRLKNGLGYIKEAHIVLTQNKTLYIYSVWGYLLCTIPVLLTVISFDPHGILSTTFTLIGYFFMIGFFVILPVLLHTNGKSKKASTWEISKVLFANALKVQKLGLSLLGLLILMVVILMVLSLIFVGDNSLEQFFPDTTKVTGFGFYPVKAISIAIGFLATGFIYFTPIMYMLERKSVIVSVVTSIRRYRENFYNLLPLISIYAVFYFFYTLIVPDGNFYAKFLLAPVEAYFSLLSSILVFKLYKDKYGITVSHVRKSLKSVKATGQTKKQTIKKWSLITLAVLLIEAGLFMGYVLSETLLNSDNSALSNSLLETYFVFAVSALILFFVIRLDKRSIRFTAGLSVLAFLVLSSITYAVGVNYSEPVPLVIPEQKFTGDELFEAINDKREKYGIPGMKKNAWACEVARIELKNNLTVGNGYFAPNDTFIQAIEEARSTYLEKATDSSDTMPTILFEYMTYGYDLEQTIDGWDSGPNKLIFLDKTYTHGCAVTQDGYGVVITAEETEESIPVTQYYIST